MPNLTILFQTTTTAEEDAVKSAVEGALFDGRAVAIGLGVLLLFVFALVSIAWIRTWGWNDGESRGKLRGLALPNGSVRSVLALLIVGGFIVFAFIGRGIVGEGDEFTAVLGAWITLTGTVTGFYFGSRTGQTLAATDNDGNGNGNSGNGNTTPTTTATTATTEGQ